MASNDQVDFEIISINETAKLNSLFDRAKIRDVHCLPNYLKLFQDYGYGEGLFVFYARGEDFILTPYFKRTIDEEDNYYDLISPWYYGGPVHNLINEHKINDIVPNYLNEFNKYCKENKIISEFQRMNPINENQKIFQIVNDKHVFFDRKIVYMDLTKSDEEIWLEYNRHTRKNINKATREGLSVYRSDNPKKDIDIFIEIYQKAMEEKETSQFYFFNERFFKDLADWFNQEISIFLIEYKNEIVTASLELGKYGILHDYLRGSNPEHHIFRPTEILLHEIAKWAKEHDYEYFAIGGGRTNSEDDQLLRFKKKMSPNIKDYYLYKKIHDQKTYEELCKHRGITEKLQYLNASFFPEYRKKTDEN